MSVCRKLLRMLDQLSKEFTKEYELRRMVAAGDQADGQGI